LESHNDTIMVNVSGPPLESVKGSFDVVDSLLNGEAINASKAVITDEVVTNAEPLSEKLESKVDQAIVIEKAPKISGSLSKTYGKFAYAYIIAGCTLESCNGYVLNAIVASQVLQHYNSTADAVFWVRMAAQLNDTTLPVEIENWLHKAGVKLQYLPKVRYDNFGTATMEKFRVLEMTEYDRVYFLDSDKIPLRNTDYHLELSYRGYFQEYVAIAGSAAPITASAFMVTPKKGMFGKVMDIVHRHRNKTENATILDPFDGWGHRIMPGECLWKTWTWYGVGVDQGIIFQWMMAEQMNITRVAGKNIETWQEVTSNVEYWRTFNKKVIEVSSNRYIAMVNQTKSLWNNGPLYGSGGKYEAGLMGDFYHFAGGGKPWSKGIRAENIPSVYNVSSMRPQEVWLYFLGEANRTLALNLPSFLAKFKGYPLGTGLDAKTLLDPIIEIPKPLDH
jgi:hypothetical protein